MSKGEQTRATIVTQSLDLASVVGLNALSIGTIADHTGMSKSGLFAHFGSKEALQLAVLDAAEERFVDIVVRPAFRAQRGIARLRALFEQGLGWDKRWAGRGGCIFKASESEFDDQPGPVRDRLVEAQRKWRETILGAIHGAIKTGEFPPDLDCEQFAHDCQGIGLAFVHASRLMRDPNARARAARAFETLLQGCRAPGRAASLPSAAASSGRRR